jgi:hypothetical protein
MAFGELKETQRVMWGAGPSERYGTDEGIRQSRTYLIALGTRP